MEPRVVLMDRNFSRETLDERGALDLRNIGDDAWQTIVSSCRAGELRLYHLMLRSLAGIERLRSTTRLSICWANQLKEIAPIYRMFWLESLSLSDFPKLHTIEGIESLQSLVELHLSGNLGSLHPPLRLNSVKAISQLPKLEKLELLNLRLENHDISFIASSFPNLRSLTLSNEFDRAQFAFLAKRLNAQLERPIAAYVKLSVTCRKCLDDALYQFTGRRMPVICRHCDGESFDKLSRSFDRLMQTS